MQGAGVDNTFRKKFDREEYLERARKRELKVFNFTPFKIYYFCFKNVFFFFFEQVIIFLVFV